MSKLPRSFNEFWYLKLNPDVQEAVEKDFFESGAQHYLMYGFKESRKYNCPDDDEKKDDGKRFIISPKLFIKKRYRAVYGEKLDLRNPSGFNEKILWLTLYWKHPLVVKCTDKYAMRKYAEEAGLGNILPKIYGVYHTSSEIDWAALPEKFVLKCNHGCGYNIICNDKEILDKQEAGMKLDRWLKEDFGKKFFEPQYSKIKPLIICEEYIQPNDGLLPHDYKIYCFGGQPKLILVCSERDKDLKLEWHDLEWVPLDIGLKPNLGKMKKPDSLDEMIRYAAQLSKPFPFVRVDFYDLLCRPVLGELTFTPAYGMAGYYSKKGNEYLGTLLELPRKKIKTNYK